MLIAAEHKQQSDRARRGKELEQLFLHSELRPVYLRGTPIGDEDIDDGTGRTSYTRCAMCGVFQEFYRSYGNQRVCPGACRRNAIKKGLIAEAVYRPWRE